MITVLFRGRFLVVFFLAVCRSNQTLLSHHPVLTGFVAFVRTVCGARTRAKLLDETGPDRGDVPGGSLGSDVCGLVSGVCVWLVNFVRSSVRLPIPSSCHHEQPPTGGEIISSLVTEGVRTLSVFNIISFVLILLPLSELQCNRHQTPRFIVIVMHILMTNLIHCTNMLSHHLALQVEHCSDSVNVSKPPR